MHLVTLEDLLLFEGAHERKSNGVRQRSADMDDGLCSGVFFPGAMRDISNLQLL